MPLPENRIHQIMSRMGSNKTLILGDLMLDRYLYGEVQRISPEAPVPVVEVKKETFALGGAANVAANIRALGDTPLVVGVVGNDALAEVLRVNLRDNGVDPDHIVVDESRQTTVKTRVIGENQQVVRIDREDRHELSENVEASVLAAFTAVADEISALVISDYGKGVITKSLLGKLIPEARRRNIFVAVDPKETHFMSYTDVSIITPNHHEASFAAGIRITDESALQRAGGYLLKELHLESLLITRGKDGMTLFERRGSGGDFTMTHFPTFARKVFDVTGAGDTVIASFVSAVAAGASLKEATVISNCAAGVVVGELGAATVSHKRLTEELLHARTLG
ncbi:MAG TPA: D-glycero-beta-D-manno-heptose-7-phosphate kinase [candidate division Zixibacteria bacterium]|nr:D-glycero-beta-D-manno-heptose-7-phosphate kinase [candidate division Zixibacteria bacterium]